MPSQGLGDPLHEPGILSIALGISIQGSSMQRAITCLLRDLEILSMNQAS
jgi:hypothetical protein